MSREVPEGHKRGLKKLGLQFLMAQYQHLPIYKLTYDLLIRVMQVIKNYPREYKYTLGQKLKEMDFEV